MVEISKRVPVNFALIEGNDPGGSLAAAADRARIFGLLPSIDATIGRMVNQTIAKVVATIDRDGELGGDLAIGAWYEIAAAVRLRRSLMVEATVDTGAK